VLEKENLMKGALLGLSILVCVGAAFCKSGGQEVKITPPPPTKVVTKKQETMLQIYVSGAVAKPGIYFLPKGTRVYAAISKAGGLTENADQSRVNLVKICKDGTHIRVPELKKKKVPRPKKEKRTTKQVRTRKNVQDSNE
jgi:competence protein ComEA